MLRRPGFGAWVVLVALAASACVAPAQSFSAYESKAVDSAESATSDAGSAILAAGLAADGRLEVATTSLILQDAEIGATSTADTFASIQPPDGASDALRAELLPRLRSAADTIGLMRIAARRDVRVTVSREDLPTMRVEAWARDTIISRIPGNARPSA